MKPKNLSKNIEMSPYVFIEMFKYLKEAIRVISVKHTHTYADFVDIDTPMALVEMLGKPHFETELPYFECVLEKFNEAMEFFNGDGKQALEVARDRLAEKVSAFKSELSMKSDERERAKVNLPYEDKSTLTPLPPEKIIVVAVVVPESTTAVALPTPTVNNPITERQEYLRRQTDSCYRTAYVSGLLGGFTFIAFAKCAATAILCGASIGAAIGTGGIVLGFIALGVGCLMLADKAQKELNEIDKNQGKCKGKQLDVGMFKGTSSEKNGASALILRATAVVVPIVTCNQLDYN